MRNLRKADLFADNETLIKTITFFVLYRITITDCKLLIFSLETIQISRVFVDLRRKNNTFTPFLYNSGNEFI